MIEDIDKNNLKMWLSKEIGTNLTRFDKIIDFNEKILDYIKYNNLNLSIPENIFLMQLVKYVYNNTNA